MVCIDANLLIWSLVPSPMTQAAILLLERWRSDGTTLIAPVLLAYEVTASLRRLVYLKSITPDEGEEAFARFAEVEVRLSHPPEVIPLAWALAKQLNRSRAYDTAYLALAQLNDCDFWTADERLYNAVHAKLAWVKWVGNVSPA